MLRAIAAVQRLGDLRHRVLAAAVAQLGQLLRVAFASQDGADDLQAGHAGDVAEHLGQLQVHQLQRLLHALDVLAGQAHQVGALADVVAQRLGGLVGLEDRPATGRACAGVESTGSRVCRSWAGP